MKEKTQGKTMTEKNRTSFLLRLAEFFVLMTVIACVYCVLRNRITIEKLYEIDAGGNANYIPFVHGFIDESKYHFQGVVLEKEARVQEIQILIQASDTTDGVRKKTKKISELDNYREILRDGFEFTIDKDLLDSEDVYSVYLLIPQKEKTYKYATGKYIYQGELYDYDPTVFFLPEIHDENIKKVITDGNLRAYDLEQGIYFYQLGSQLYWIVGDWCERYETDMYIPCHITTLYVDELPENLQQYGFDNNDFFFASREIKTTDTNYRVATHSLEKDYPPISISTGLYDLVESRWIMSRSFLFDSAMFNNQ